MGVNGWKITERKHQGRGDLTKLTYSRILVVGRPGWSDITGAGGRMMEDEEPDQICRVIRYQGWGILFFFFNLLNLFIFGCVGSSLLRAGFLSLWRVGATLHCVAQASYCGGFSCCGARALGARASVVVACGL